MSYYRMHRGWMDNDAFTAFGDEPYSKRAAWVWLIESAMWQRQTIWIDRQAVELERGELSHSERFLASRWKWSRSKVHRFLTDLTTFDMIHLRTAPVQKSSQQTDHPQNILTICNYGKYQDNGTISEPSTGPSLNHLPDQRRRTKEVNKEKKKEISPSLRSDFLVWYAAYPNKKAPQEAERAYTKARAKASAEELLAGIERYRSGKPDYANWAHPASWLNKERWLDEYGAPGSGGGWDDYGPKGPAPKPEDLWPDLKLVQGGL